nr:MAG: RNA-dependent RNA polymerase [Porcine picobirnavirus]
MPKSKVASYFDDAFALPNPGLEAYFGLVRKGRPVEYRTGFAYGKSTTEVLNEWMPNLKPLESQWPTLLKYEEDLAKKVGPLSFMKPLSERMDDIDHYYDDILLPSIPLSGRAIAAVLSEWASARGLELRSQQHTVESMKLSTNSGSPFFTSRRSALKASVPCGIFKDNQRVIQVLRGEPYNAAAVLGWRGQEGGPSVEDVKQRVVWMFPFGVNIAELQCYQPLIETAQRFNLVPAWVSMDAVDAEITRLFDTKGKDDLVICTDFTRFDQHFNQDCQDAARSILQGILNSAKQSQTWLEYVFPIKFMIPLAYDMGKVRFGHHGMGSGSGGTNADETLVHRALQYEAAILNSSRLNPHSQCLGDDGILSFPGATVDKVVDVYSRHGLDMNLDKQYASTTDCTYLRRWHHIDYRKNGICVGVYSTARALGRLCEQERYYSPDTWGPEPIVIRELSILENVKNHPLREQFVQFCIQRDKSRLGLDLPGFYDNLDKIVRKTNDLIPDFLGYTKSQQLDAGQGINSWWIVNYVKSLR